MFCKRYLSTNFTPNPS